MPQGAINVVRIAFVFVDLRDVKFLFLKRLAPGLVS